MEASKTNHLKNISLGLSKEANEDHSWRGTWDRPVKVDEKSFDKLTIARMTDHNVRGIDGEKLIPSEKAPKYENQT